MLTLGIESLKRTLQELRSIVSFEDYSRRHFTEDPSLEIEATAAGAELYVQARGSLPAAVSHQVYSHCACVTRLYAIYEFYIYELVTSWLTELSRLVTWDEMPPELCRNYRNGVGILLQKFGGPRTAHLTELSIVESLRAGLTGEQPLNLVADAFFIELPNLRENDLASLFSRVGLTELSAWLSSYPPLTNYCAQNDFTVTSRLKSLIEFRNDAAHGAIEVDEVLGNTEFLSYVEFIECLCEGISEFVRSNIVDRASTKGHVEEIGEITEFFAAPGASIATMKAATIKHGNQLTIRTPTQCFLASVGSIRVDDVDVTEVDAIDGQELGICFAPPARRGTILVLRPWGIAETIDDAAQVLPAEPGEAAEAPP